MALCVMCTWCELTGDDGVVCDVHMAWCFCFQLQPSPNTSRPDTTKYLVCACLKYTVLKGEHLFPTSMLCM